MHKLPESQYIGELTKDVISFIRERGQPQRIRMYPPMKSKKKPIAVLGQELFAAHQHPQIYPSEIQYLASGDSSGKSSCQVELTRLKEKARRKMIQGVSTLICTLSALQDVMCPKAPMEKRTLAPDFPYLWLILNRRASSA